MYETAYDIVALAMRYWFVLIVVYILFRLVQNVLLEFSSERTAQKRAAGFALGLVEVVAPAGSALTGRTFALRRENTIGSARKCDIRLRSRTVDSLHAAIYQKGNKVFLSDYGTRRGVLLNGRRIKKDIPLMDGDEIALGDVVLLLHISGIEPISRGESYYYEDDEQDEPMQDEGEGFGEDGLPDGGDEPGNGSRSYGFYDDDDAPVDDEEDTDEDADDEGAYGEDDEDAYDGEDSDWDDDLQIPDESGRLSYRKAQEKDKWHPYGDKRGLNDHW